MTQSPEEIIKHLGESFRKVRLGGGVVGKTTHCVLGLVPVWLTIVIKLSSNALENVFLIGAGLVATAVVVWWVKRTHEFAEKNPVQAMLSGAEFVEYQRAFAAQTKSISAPNNTVPIADPRLPEQPSSDPAKDDQ